MKETKQIEVLNKEIEELKEKLHYATHYPIYTIAQEMVKEYLDDIDFDITDKNQKNVNVAISYVNDHIKNQLYEWNNDDIEEEVKKRVQVLVIEENDFCAHCDKSSKGHVKDCMN